MPPVLFSIKIVSEGNVSSLRLMYKHHFPCPNRTKTQKIICQIVFIMSDKMRNLNLHTKEIDLFILTNYMSIDMCSSNRVGSFSKLSFRVYSYIQSNVQWACQNLYLFSVTHRDLIVFSVVIMCKYFLGCNNKCTTLNDHGEFLGKIFVCFVKYISFKTYFIQLCLSK